MKQDALNYTHIEQQHNIHLPPHGSITESKDGTPGLSRDPDVHIKRLEQIRHYQYLSSITLPKPPLDSTSTSQINNERSSTANGVDSESNIATKA